MPGGTFEPARVHRMARALETGYVRDGHLDARVRVSHAPHGPQVDLCVAADPGPRVTIRSFQFAGRRAVPEAALIGALHGERARINRVGGVYDADALIAESPWLLAQYHERGYALAEIGEPVARREGNGLDVVLPIREGPLFRIGVVTVAGTRRFPHGLTGTVFQRSRVQAVREQIARASRGEVSIGSRIDRDTQRIDISFEIEWRWPWDAIAFWASRWR
jgi:outer membrane protein assembly factor BamA